MKCNKLKLYLSIEFLLYIVLLVLQIIHIFKGNSLFGNNGNIPISIFHVLLTFFSFAFALILSVNKSKKGKTIEDLFSIYFMFALIADIIFFFYNI